MTDKSEKLPKLTLPDGKRAYWLPGISGIVLEASLADFVNHQGDARLVVVKQSANGVAHYAVELNKEPPKVKKTDPD